MRIKLIILRASDSVDETHFVIIIIQVLILENMAINAVLPPKATRRNAIANRKVLGPRNTSELISIVPFTFVMRRHLIPLAP